MFEEFKKFALKGNVIDLAVGVIIGGAFGKIVSSLVADVIMPLLSLILGKIDLSTIAITLVEKTAEKEAVTLPVGVFMQNVLDFLVISIAIFFFIKLISVNPLKELKKKIKHGEITHADEAALSAPPEPTNEEKLLAEIRDLLKERAGNGK